MPDLEFRSPDSGTAVDARGLRFAAVLTTGVLAAALVTVPSPVGVGLLVAQTIGFALAAAFGARANPYGLLFRRAIAPRLASRPRPEHPAPPRFAQAVGLVFGLTALAGVALGSVTVTYLAIAAALAAAFLNAAFGFCLGCELYLRAARLRHRSAARTRTEQPPPLRRPHIEGETA